MPTKPQTIYLQELLPLRHPNPSPNPPLPPCRFPPTTHVSHDKTLSNYCKASDKKKGKGGGEFGGLRHQESVPMTGCSALLPCLFRFLDPQKE